MTLFIWDMSHYNNPSIGNAVTEGISVITHKAGGDTNDTEIGTWWSGVKNLRPSVLLGAYWVLYPGNASARADAFLARLDATCPGWRDHAFLLQVDCEEWSGDASTVPSKADITTFCNRLVAEVPTLRPVVYAPEWVYGGKLSGLGYPLWASTYVTGSGNFKTIYPGDGSSRWGAYSGQTPAILQYADTAEIGGQSPCDASAYRGTLAQLIALVAPGWEDDVPLTTTDIQAVAAAVVLKIRTTYPVMSDGDKGALVTAFRAYTDPQFAAILAAINAESPTSSPSAELPSPEAVLASLGDTTRTPEEVADDLAAVLGPRAAAIGAALQARAATSAPRTRTPSS